ncbi:MAG: hypothetical protein OXG35_16265 [Acidobacteria bacterium]|nr:hypothetical protein [Acidobacteriota bacterium]
MGVMARLAVAVAVAVAGWPLAGELAWSGSGSVARAQTPPLVCDVAFPTGPRGTVPSRHGCWLSETGGQGSVPWPAPGSFAPGSVVTVYSLRWDGGTPRVYCSAESSRGAAYDRWFVAAAVRGWTFLQDASYGVAAGSVPGGDRVVSGFVGGRRQRAVWERESWYDVDQGVWVSGRWAEHGSASTPAFYRAGGGGEVAIPETVVEETWGRAGQLCPEVGLLPRQLGDRADPGGAVAGARVEPGRRCLEAPAGRAELFDGDRFNAQALYLPGQGRFGDEEDDEEEQENGREEQENGEEGDGDNGEDDSADLGRDDPRFDGHRTPPDLPPDCDFRPGAPDCDVCLVDPLYCEWRDWDDDDGGQGQGPGNTPALGQGGVTDPPAAISTLGTGRALGEEAVVLAFSSGMACVERESIVLQAYERQRWVDTSYDEYDVFCDAQVTPVRPFYCDGAGFDLVGLRRVSSGYSESWTEHRWDPNPAETDAHYPWARLFWHDGGGRAGLESGGVLMGDDGSGVCLIDRGFVRNSALPWPVPSVTDYVAGAWADYGSGAVRVECPEDDGSAGLTSVPAIAGAPPPAFDATVGVDFAPAIHEAAEAESYTLEQYRSMRPCTEWPGEETPVPGVDCGVDLAPVSPVRLARLRASERQVSSGPSVGSISGFYVDSVAALMRHDWDVRRASGLAGRVDLDTRWRGGGDVGSGVAEAGRSFGPRSGWEDCGRRDYLMGSGTDSLWGAWVARARAGRAAEMAASAGLLGLASGLDPRTTVNCASNGVCTPDDEGFAASHAAIFAQAEVLYRGVEADPGRVCAIGDQVSPPGP